MSDVKLVITPPAEPDLSLVITPPEQRNVTVGLALPGPAGADGYTPVRGTDYWTAADIATMESYINSYVDTVILGGAS